jgi:hypothetical protein
VGRPQQRPARNNAWAALRWPPRGLQTRAGWPYLADVSYSASFDEPIPRAKGKPLHTLRHPADHVVALPKAKSALPHWQLAVRCLMSAAEKRGPVMMAHIAMVKALDQDIRR